MNDLFIDAQKDKYLLIATKLSLLRFFANSNHNKYLHTTSCNSFSLFIIFPKKCFLFNFFLVFFIWEISAKNKVQAFILYENPTISPQAECSKNTVIFRLKRFLTCSCPFLVCKAKMFLHAFLFIRMVFFRFNMDILNFWANIILIYS